jgi:hypothetical protein
LRRDRIRLSRRFAGSAGVEFTDPVVDGVSSRKLTQTTSSFSVGKRFRIFSNADVMNAREFDGCSSLSCCHKAEAS